MHISSTTNGALIDNSQPIQGINSHPEIILASNEKALATFPIKFTEEQLNYELIDFTSHSKTAIDDPKQDAPQQQKLLALIEESAPGVFSNCIPTNEDWDNTVKSLNLSESKLIDIISLLIELMGKVGESMRKRGEQILPTLSSIHIINYTLGCISSELINQSTLNSSKTMLIDAIKQTPTAGVNYYQSQTNNNFSPISIKEINDTTTCSAEVLHEGQSIAQHTSAQQLNDYTELGSQVSNISQSMLGSLYSIDKSMMYSLLSEANNFINLDSNEIANAIVKNDNAFSKK